MNELYLWSMLVMKLTGPLMLACLGLMFAFLYYINRKPPKPNEVILGYVRFHSSRKGHIGILTYTLIISFIFFVISLAGLALHYFLAR